MSTFQFTHTVADRPTDHYRARFLDVYAYLTTTDMFKTMEQTVEGSPWHREANVKVHTDMVVSEYIRMTDETCSEWSSSDFLGAISCAFHDTGKPASKIEKYREDRGHYFAFHGHETVSSRMFESWAVDDANGLLKADEIFKICWMIEHHMPWEMAVPEKRRWLALTANVIGIDVYTRALLADQYGRIADDQEAKNARAETWITEFKQLADTAVADEINLDAPALFVLIGTSGSGKSSLTAEMLRNAGAPIEIFSLDALRHEWYDDRKTPEGYRNAFAKSVEDKDFESKADRAFSELLKRGNSIVVDNVNAGAKRRGKYIRQARQNGYVAVAVTMPVSLNTVLERQTTRSDKSVPNNAVEQQYASIQQPSFGEFDDIVISPHNMKPSVDE